MDLHHHRGSELAAGAAGGVLGLPVLEGAVGKGSRRDSAGISMYEYLWGKSQ